ncbi:transposase [Protofrankia symbiont of Coriaria ruscifolia]|uniref:transposase n=1 Tax=Protofrankia symbiont of Coriaria ruscifolia TaxID=1306542 RepID=UPI003D6C73EF
MAGLPGLDGFEAEQVEREADGSFSVHVVSAPGTVACCPRCQAEASRVWTRVGHTVSHLVLVPMRVTWHKRVMACMAEGCEQGRFTEEVPLAARGGRVSLAALGLVGHLVGDGLVTVDTAAEWAGVAWHTAHGAFTRLAAEAGIVATDPAAVTEALAGDEELAAEAELVDGPGVEDPERAGCAPAAIDPEVLLMPRSVLGPMPLVRVLGIDDQRRGARRFHTDPVSGTWVADADRWQTVFIDTAGGHGLLGMVEGRRKAPAVAWILALPERVRAGIKVVTMDLSTTYRAVAREALPHALVCADLFHVAQLVNKMVDDVRRRNSHRLRGRRGRARDPEYAVRNLFRWGPRTLSRRGRRRILDTLSALELVDPQTANEIRIVWTAKNLLLEVFALALSRTGRATCRTEIAHVLFRFFDYVAILGRDIPELVTLAETIDTWLEEITKAVLTGVTNAAAEGVNRITKLVYRGAFGFRNVTNQQLRARYVASRAARPEWRPGVTIHTLAA